MRPRTRRSGGGVSASVSESVAVALRGRPRSQEADRAIAEAAVALLDEVGYADLTMAGVAARAGVSTATLYRRFASKEELVVSAIQLIVDRAEPADTGSLEGDLRTTMRRVAAKISENRVLLSLSSELLRHPKLAAEIRRRLSEPLWDSLVGMIERAVGRGEIPEVEDPDVAIAVVFGPVHYLFLATGEPVDEAQVDRIVPLVLRALGYQPG